LKFIAWLALGVCAPELKKISVCKFSGKFLQEEGSTPNTSEPAGFCIMHLQKAWNEWFMNQSRVFA